MRKWLIALSIVALVLALAAAPALANPTRDHDATTVLGPGPRTPGPELATPPYPLYTYYSDLGAKLADIDAKSDRVQVIQDGFSAAGQPLYLVVITWPMKNKQWQANDTYRKTLMTTPGTVIKKNWLKNAFKNGVRPAAFINCSIHGGETTGTDAGLLLIKKLAFGNDDSTKAILKNLIIVIDACQNPDGRVTDLRANNNGFDCNRDFAQLSQPETQWTLSKIKQWLPLTFTDLHGYVNPMLLEPTTMPHNPNLEYDLLIKWGLPLARYQTDMMEKNTGLTTTIPYLWGTAEDLTEDVNEGWDDYGPYYTPQLAQEYGAIAQTVETAYKTDEGVWAHYYIIWGQLKYQRMNKQAMAYDQALLLYRGDANVPSSETGRPWTSNMADMIRPVPYYLPDGSVNPAFPYSNKVGDLTFPYAYVIPVDPALQKDVLQAYRGINHMIGFGCEVHKAKKAFGWGGVTYPAGTYVIKTPQPLRSLVNNYMWDGEDVKAVYGVNAMYDVSVWSLPYTWGFTRHIALNKFSAKLELVSGTQAKKGVVTGAGPMYWFSGDNNWATRVVNGCISRGVPAGMVTRKIAAPYDTIPLGTFVVDATSKWAKNYIAWAAANYGVDFTSIDGLKMEQLSAFPSTKSGAGNTGTPKIMVNVDAQTIWALKNISGFNNNPRSPNIISTAAPTGNGTFINSSSSVTPATVTTWMNGDNGTVRRTYIGIGKGGTGYGATNTLETLIPTCTVAGDPDPTGGDNGMCAVDIAADDLMVSGYPAKDFVFAYPPAWYSVTDPAVKVNMTYADGGKGAGAYQSGFWDSPANMTGSVGSPAMLTYEPVDHGRIVFMGFQPTYRAQMENTYLLVARAILLSLATPPTLP